MQGTSRTTIKVSCGREAGGVRGKHRIRVLHGNGGGGGDGVGAVVDGKGDGEGLLGLSGEEGGFVDVSGYGAHGFVSTVGTGVGAGLPVLSVYGRAVGVTEVPAVLEFVERSRGVGGGCSGGVKEDGEW